MNSSEKTASDPVRRVTDRFYSGIWGVLGRLFKVPRDAPELPVRPGERVEAFRPAPGFLRRLRVEFVIGLIFVTVSLFSGAIGISFFGWGWLAGLLSFPLAVTVDIIFAAVGYIAIHLRYDTTWYVMNDRSIRFRRGIWVIQETTITFENVQNVAVSQGPIQRLFGISNVKIETAGGGGAAEQGKTGGHKGIIEGVADPHRIRDMILARLRVSRSAGLGDEAEQRRTSQGLSVQHLDMLREIREIVQSAAARC